MKKICYGFALLLFGVILSNIPNETFQIVAILLGVIGLIVLAIGLMQTDGKIASAANAKDAEPSEADSTVAPSNSEQ